MVEYKLNLKIKQHVSDLSAYIIFAAIIAIILFYIINNYIWLKKSFPIPTSNDEAFHLTYMIHPLLKKGHFSLSLLKGMFGAGSADPLYIFFAVLLNILKKSFIATKMLNIIYFTLLLIAVYKLGKYSMNREAGLFAAIILSLYPVVYGISRIFCEEFALIGIVTLSILFLSKSNYFKNRRYSLLFGISAAIGIMIKYPFMLFVVGPITYILFKSFTSQAAEKTKIFLNLLFSVLIVVLIIFPRYWNLSVITNKIIYDPFVESIGLFEDLNIYTLGIINRQITLPFFLLFLSGVYFFLKHAKKEIKSIFLLWILIPWIFFIFMPHNKSSRFIIPFLPAIALISAFGISVIKRKVVKIPLVFLMILIGVIQYYDFSFGIGINLDKIKFSIFKIDIPYFNNESCHKPLKDKIYNEVISYVSKKTNESKERVLLLIPPSDYINADIWTCFLWFKDVDVPFSSVILKNDHNFLPELLKTLEDADVILYSGNINDLKTLNLYFDQQIEKLRYFYHDHFFKKQLSDFESFLQNNYLKYKGQFLKEIDNFKIVRCLDDKEGNIFYLLEREPF